MLCNVENWRIDCHKSQNHNLGFRLFRERLYALAFEPRPRVLELEPSNNSQCQKFRICFRFEMKKKTLFSIRKALVLKFGPIIPRV